jgi:hypothetical protein
MVKRKAPAINSGTFLSGINWIRPWCTIADVKITFPDDPESDIEAMRELLGNSEAKIMELVE